MNAFLSPMWFPSLIYRLYLCIVCSNSSDTWSIVTVRTKLCVRVRVCLCGRVCVDANYISPKHNRCERCEMVWKLFPIICVELSRYVYTAQCTPTQLLVHKFGMSCNRFGFNDANGMAWHDIAQTIAIIHIHVIMQFKCAHENPLSTVCSPFHFIINQWDFSSDSFHTASPNFNFYRFNNIHVESMQMYQSRRKRICLGCEQRDKGSLFVHEWCAL